MIVDYKIAMSRSGDPGGEEYRQGMKKCHKRSADRILDLCRRNGGVFIKVGQHVASLQYLLPGMLFILAHIAHTCSYCSYKKNLLT